MGKNRLFLLVIGILILVSAYNITKSVMADDRPKLSLSNTQLSNTQNTQKQNVDQWKVEYNGKAARITEAIMLLDTVISQAEEMGAEGIGFQKNNNTKELVSMVKGKAREARKITLPIPASASKEKAYFYQQYNDLANNACDMVENGMDAVMIGNLRLARQVSDQAKATLRDIDFLYDSNAKIIK